MDCTHAREAISALLDGEPVGADRSLVEQHLAGCAACRAWREEAHALTRRTRLAAAGEHPAPNPELLDAALAEWDGRTHRAAIAMARGGLVLIAVAQAAFALRNLLLGSDHGAPIHVAHEMGSFELALAAGFLVAAWFPSRARGMIPLVGCVALLLVGTATLDLVEGHTVLADEAPHLLAVAGWLLLARFSTLVPSSGEDPDVRLPWLARRRTDRPPALAAQASSRPGETYGGPDSTCAGPGTTSAGNAEPPARRAAVG